MKAYGQRKDNTDRVKRSMISQPYEKGGLNMTYIDNYITAYEDGFHTC